MNAPANMPSWPALMPKPLAASYVGLTKARFQEAIALGELPLPITVAGEERWSRAEIDRRLEQLVGGEVPDWRKAAPAYHGRLD